MIQQACELFPQIEDKIDLIEIGTPITNKHYIGNIYNALHNFPNISKKKPRSARDPPVSPGNPPHTLGLTLSNKKNIF